MRGTAVPLVVVTSASHPTAKARAAEYARGGAFALTDRLFCTDALRGTLPAAAVASVVLVAAAKTTRRNGNVAFGVRALRRRGLADGAVAAFAEWPWGPGSDLRSAMRAVSCRRVAGARICASVWGENAKRDGCGG